MGRKAWGVVLAPHRKAEANLKAENSALIGREKHHGRGKDL